MGWSAVVNALELSLVAALAGVLQVTCQLALEAKVACTWLLAPLTPCYVWVVVVRGIVVA